MKKSYKSLVIAVDGPAASGKGAVAKRLAEYFGYQYLDTGKLYRLVGIKSMQANIALDVLDENNVGIIADIAAIIKAPDIDGYDLLGEGIGAAASIISAIPEVRKALLDFQRKVASSPEGAVLDGRDIATVVCPDADFSFFITADLEKRAERRYKELQKQEDSIIYSHVLQDLEKRDARDSGRDISPLRCAGDAIRVDTTDMTLDEVFEKVLSIVKPAADI